MKAFRVLGGGRNGEVTANAIAQAAEDAGVPVGLETITDMAEILSDGVMSTPGGCWTLSVCTVAAFPTRSTSEGVGMADLAAPGSGRTSGVTERRPPIPNRADSA